MFVFFSHLVGDKPVFHCELCPTTCGRKTDLRIHVQKLHTAEKPLKCKRCGNSFPDRYSYKVSNEFHSSFFLLLNNQKSNFELICSYHFLFRSIPRRTRVKNVTNAICARMHRYRLVIWSLICLCTPIKNRFNVRNANKPSVRSNYSNATLIYIMIQIMYHRHRKKRPIFAHHVNANFGTKVI